MAITIKEYSELKQICTQQNKVIRDIQETIGLKLLTSTNKDVDSKIIADYEESLKQTKENDEKIIAIKKLAEKIDKSTVSIQEAQNKIKQINQQQQQAYIELGSSLYSYYRPSYSEFFKAFYDEANEAKKHSESLEKQIELLKEQMTQQSFFTKIFNQVKLTSNITALTQQRKKVEGIFFRAGNAIVNSNSLELICKEADLEIPVQKAINNCDNVKRDFTNTTNELASLEEKDKKLKKEFQETSQGLNLKAKIAFVEKQNSLEDKKRSLLAFSCGQQITMNDISQENFTLKDNSILNQFEQVNSLIIAMKELRLAEDKLSLYQIELDITNTEKKVEGMQKSILDNKSMIESLLSTNENLASEIVNQGNIKDSLIVRKTELENKIYQK